MTIQTRILYADAHTTTKSWQDITLDLDQMGIRYFFKTEEGHTIIDMESDHIVVELSYAAFHEAYQQWKENVRLGINGNG